MLNLKIDLVSAIKRQFGFDDEKKKREEAKLRADPAIATRISQYRQKYPHLTAGIMLSAAKAGYDVNDPRLDKLGELAARRKLSKGAGWYSPGDDPSLKDNPRQWFEEVAEGTKPRDQGSIIQSFKPLIRATTALGQTGGEFISAVARGGAAAIQDKDISKLVSPLTEEKYTGIEAIKNVVAGQGAGLGQGYFPHGSTTEAQAEAARNVYSITYSDKPIFRAPGAEDPAPAPHAGTLGRILMKDISEPGSFWFQAGSGIIDAAAALFLDPAAKASKIVGERAAVSKVFTAEEAGRKATNLAEDVAATPPASTALTPFTDANVDESLRGLTHAQITAELSSRAGLINGRRQSVHGPTFTNWLTTDRTGRKFAQWTSENDDAYTIWKTLGGEDGKFPTLLAKQMADTRTPEEAVQVLSPQLGTGLRLKPSVNSFSPVGGMFEGVGIKNSARSVRLLQTLPHGAIDFTDVDETATQLVRHMRNAKRSEADIGVFFDELASTTDPLQRKTLLRIMDYSNAQHIAETELTRLDVQHSTPALNRNFARLRAMYGQDDEILEEINRLHASRGTVVRNVLIDGELSNPLRSHFEELEDSSQMYRPAAPREVRRITSTYGRLLNHPTLDLPVAVLDHINNLLKGMAILRPALAPRVIGEEHARMAVAGYDTMFNHPLSYIAFLTGKKGSSDVFGENFDAMREFTPFRKALAKQADLHTNLTAEHTTVLPFTDKRFVKAWANDIQDLIDDPVTARLAGRWGDEVTSGDNLADTKRWLASDHPEAVEYRAANPHITPDSLDSFVDNANDTFISKTFNNESLKEAVRTGTHNNEPIFTVGERGPKFSRSFQAHLKSLTDADKGPDLTIGDFSPPATVEAVTTAYRRTTDYLFSHLLTNPSNKYNRSQTFRQQYWKSAGDELMIHAAPDTQKALIQSAIDNNLDADTIKSFRALAKTGAGDLTLDEVDLFAKARALEAVKSLLYDLSDRNQFMDIMRLIFPFGEAWKEGITAWSKLSRARPQIIPRALMVVNGIQDSGFFYTDPVSGEEMFAWPGGHIAMNALTGIPTPVQSQVQSLNMITGGGNPLMPGFGAIPQELVRNFLPDVPKWDGVRELVAPYAPKDPDNPFNFLPSWAQHLRDYIGSPANEVAFANTRADVMRYLYSTGKYDLSNSASLAQFEAEATKIARTMSLIHAGLQGVLPAAPSFRDVAMDKEGHTTLAFAMVEEYRKLLETDRENNTNLAVTTFIDKYGENNLLYMQSATKGGDVFSKSGYDWVRENADIAKSYPGVYSFFAPSDGGLDMKAYHALFENGERKPLSPREFLEAAQNRVAKMAYRNAQDKLPDPNKRTKAQKQWLRDVKAQLLSDFPGFVPEFQGSDIPKTIRELSDAVTNPKLSKNPQAQAISEYLTARQKVIDQALSRKTPIDGWQTAKAMKSSRDWLRDIAADITSRYPSFKNINRELFDQELAEDD